MPSVRLLGLDRYEPPALQAETRILGLDLNRGSCGYAVVEAGGTRLLEAGTVDTSGHGDTLDIVDQLAAHLRQIRARHPAPCGWVVGIENYLKTYGFGHYNTRGLFALAELNSAAKWMCWREFGVRPHLVHPTIPRRIFGLTAKKTDSSKTNVKDTVLAYVRERFPGQFERAPQDQEEPLWDAADATLVALAAAKLETDRLALASADEFAKFRGLVLPGRAVPGDKTLRSLFERVLDSRKAT